MWSCHLHHQCTNEADERKQWHPIRVLWRLCGGGIYSKAINTFKNITGVLSGSCFTGVHFLTPKTAATFFSNDDSRQLEQRPVDASNVLSCHRCHPVIHCGKLAYASLHRRSERLTSPERLLCGLWLRVWGRKSSTGREDGTDLIKSSSVYNLCPCASKLFLS